MNFSFIYIIVALLILTVIVLIIMINKLNIKLKSKNENDQLKVQTQITEIKAKFTDEINDLKDKHREELNSEFEKGYEKGIAVSKIEVQILPFKRTVKNGNLFNRSEVYECGYQYQLFSNGLPCLEPKDVVVDSISVKELNEEGINNLLEKFNNVIEKIPNSNLIMGETISSFGKGLRELVKK